MAMEVYKGELDALIQKGAMLVDVREQDDLDGEALPGHTHLPLSRLSELAALLTTNTDEKPLVFYCRSGLMSYQAAEIAAKWTEQPVYYLSGGLLSYYDA